MTPFVFSDISGNQAWLYDEEAKHCIKVMRKREGEAVLGIDGEGMMYKARIEEIGKNKIELVIMDREPDWGEKSQQITLFVSPLHKNDRFEWLVEKSVELGVTQIVPYIGKNTVKTGLRLDRLKRICLAALKQSLRSRLPGLSEPAWLEDALDEAKGELRFMGHGPSGKPFAHHFEEIRQAKSIDLLIGPEGDFSESELEYAKDKGFSPLSLGHNRLRSETAAIHLMGLVKSAMAY